jgi:hypothetical protein
MRIKWFTLVETVITVVIMSILIWVVFEIYVVIGRMAVFIQWQKELHNELIYVVQTLQNLVDDQNILLVYDDSLTEIWWFSETLRLEDDDDTIFLSTVCDSDELCAIEMLRRDKDTAIEESLLLTNTWSIHVSQFYIKALPLENQSDPTTSFEDTLHEWFWLFLDAQVPYFKQDSRWFRVRQDLQIFYTMRKY